MKHTDHHDARRCDTGQSDHWGGCFFCGAVRGEICRDVRPEKTGPNSDPSASDSDGFGRSDGSDADF